MASEILGLFGGKNSQQLRNDALDSMMISPAQMGSQGLLQQVVSMGQNAGTMLGEGAGRLMGGKVAGEVEASYIDQAIQAASATQGTPAQKMKAVADFLADKPGMGAQYLKAMEESRNLEFKDLQTQKAQQDLNPPYKDFKVETINYKDNGQGSIVPVREYITVTRKYNAQTGNYEDPKPAETVATDGKEAPPKRATGQSKSSAEAAQRRKEENNYNPDVTPRSPPTNLPPSGSRGMTYGYEGQGLVNPEGY
tara:strand:+ start:11598 stop:12353 length:756 start_codon:yes stop_codon:yes gene_type:complete